MKTRLYTLRVHQVFNLMYLARSELIFRVLILSYRNSYLFEFLFFLLELFFFLCSPLVVLLAWLFSRNVLFK